jgi:hypothetical protein
VIRLALQQGQRSLESVVIELWEKASALFGYLWALLVYP